MAASSCLPLLQDPAGKRVRRASCTVLSFAAAGAGSSSPQGRPLPGGGASSGKVGGGLQGAGAAERLLDVLQAAEQVHVAEHAAQ